MAWGDPECGIGLATVDRSVTPSAPATTDASASGRWVIATTARSTTPDYALRSKRTQVTVLRGHSDTEPCRRHRRRGVNRLCSFRRHVRRHPVDREERSWLLRDRGREPMYTAEATRSCSAQSEGSATPALDDDVDRDALALMLRYKNVTGPYSTNRDRSLRLEHSRVPAET